MLLCHRHDIRLGVLLQGKGTSHDVVTMPEVHFKNGVLIISPPSLTGGTARTAKEEIHPPISTAASGRRGDGIAGWRRLAFG